jgi:outer membrane cobalamin receptor
LVLLNGRRLPYYGNNSIAGERAFVDLNILPLSAIERIELLTDGASTRYGSDAMAGVVNIITKSSVQGTTLSTQLTRPAGGRAPGEQFNLSWGKGKTEIDEHRVIREYTGGVILSANRKALQNSGFTLEELSQDYRQLSPSTWAKFSPYLQKDNFLLDDANTHLNALDLPNGVIPLNWAESV